MIIVTTPMCKKILEIAGLKKFKVNKHPDREEGDLAILLSESKVQMPSLAIKLNTFSQIKESILKLTNYFYDNEIIKDKVTENEILSIFKQYDVLDISEETKKSNFSKKVKVYSEFLKDIVNDLGCEIVEDNFEYIVFPDYLKSKVIELGASNESDKFKFIEIPTHSNTSKDPIIRAKERYSILINNLN